MSSKIMRFVIPAGEREFELQLRGPIVSVSYADTSENIEIHYEYYEFEEPVTRWFRVYKTGETISAGEYFTTVRRPGVEPRHVYELK